MELLEKIIPIIVIVLDYIAVFIISHGAIAVLFKYYKNNFDYKDGKLGIELAKAMALGLQFLIAAEILSTIIIGSLKDFWPLAGITILRIIIGLVLHWEINHE